MVVVPVGKTKFAGTPVRVMVTEPLHVLGGGSVALATPNSSSRVTVHDDVVVTILPGTVSVGGVVSLLDPAVTEIVWLQEATLPV